MSGVRRRVLLLAHPTRPEAVSATRQVVKGLTAAGIEPAMLAEDVAVAAASETGVAESVVLAEPTAPLRDVELLIVLGGDGTILRAIEVARGSHVPLLGVNLGHVGFLAESERDDLDDTVQRVVARDYTVEQRMTIDVVVRLRGEVVHRCWAVNEASVEKTARQRMVELMIEVDGRPVSRFGCDGVLVATPTGSTAYAFSSGGPVVWPEVEALLVVPVSAHALFARPLVVSPTSVIAVEVVPGPLGPGVLWCDGRRTFPLEPGASVEVTRGAEPVRLARLVTGPFTNRLVAKFALPVQGWRATTGS